MNQLLDAPVIESLDKDMPDWVWVFESPTPGRLSTLVTISKGIEHIIVSRDYDTMARTRVEAGFRDATVMQMSIPAVVSHIKDNPPPPRRPSVSCVGYVIIPDMTFVEVDQ